MTSRSLYVLVAAFIIWTACASELKAFDGAENGSLTEAAINKAQCLTAACIQEATELFEEARQRGEKGAFRNSAVFYFTARWRGRGVRARGRVRAKCDRRFIIGLCQVLGDRGTARELLGRFIRRDPDGCKPVLYVMWGQTMDSKKENQEIWNRQGIARRLSARPLLVSSPPRQLIH